MNLLGNNAVGVAQLIQASIAPVFLLSAVGVTLGVLTNRLARIVDRSRAMEERLATQPADAAALRERLAVMARRARLINVALTLCTITAFLVALVVVLLFANAFLHDDLSIAVATIFVASMLSLAGAFLAFLIEVRVSTASLRIGRQ